jgi:hypothetical protein
MNEEAEKKQYDIDVSQISNKLMLNFPGKTVTPVSPWEVAIDASHFGRYVVRFGKTDDGDKFYSRTHFFTLNLRTIRWGAVIILVILVATGIGLVIAIPWYLIDIVRYRNFGNKKLDPFLNEMGYGKIGSFAS